jgi:asparagine synthase (glutamine-hydrolysing)
MIDGDDEVFAAGGVPVRNTTNMTWIRDIHRRAADDGVSVLFSGSVGNNSFSRDGRRWLVELLANGRPAEAWREARAWSATRDQPLTSTIKNSVLGEMAPAWVRRWRATRRGDPPRVAAWLAGTALRPELHADVDLTAHPAITPGYRDSPIAAIGRHAPHSEVTAAQGARWDLRHADPTADVAVLEVCLRQPDWAQRHRGLSRAAARATMRGRVPDEIRLRNVRGAQLPDWYDRLTDARLEITQELVAARADPSSRALIDLDRLDLLVRHWPTPAQAGAGARTTGIGSLLPRALAVSRYLRWFDAWAREQRAARLSGR